MVGEPGSIPSSLVALDGDGDELCGSAMLLASDMGRSDISPWFAGLYVKPAYRSRGIARLLMQRVLEEARSAGATAIYLCAEVDKLSFYSSRGWSLHEQCDWHGVPIIVMSRAVG
jgi:GNAT superfamily N-acetyltransferase